MFSQGVVVRQGDDADSLAFHFLWAGVVCRFNRGRHEAPGLLSGRIGKKLQPFRDRLAKENPSSSLSGHSPASDHGDVILLFRDEKGQVVYADEDRVTTPVSATPGAGANRLPSTASPGLTLEEVVTSSYVMQVYGRDFVLCQLPTLPSSLKLEQRVYANLPVVLSVLPFQDDFESIKSQIEIEWFTCSADTAIGKNCHSSPTAQLQGNRKQDKKENAKKEKAFLVSPGPYGKTPAALHNSSASTSTTPAISQTSLSDAVRTEGVGSNLMSERYWPFGMCEYSDPATDSLRYHKHQEAQNRLVYSFGTELVGRRVVIKVSCKRCPEYFALVTNGSLIEETVEEARWNIDRVLPWDSQDKDGFLGRNSESLTILSWNILAPCYAESEGGLTNFFPFTAGANLAVRHRKPLLAREILKHAERGLDVAMFQEVSSDIFYEFLRPLFYEILTSNSGCDSSTACFKGILAVKKSKANEGVAAFYDSRRFDLLHSEIVAFQDELLNAPHHQNLRDTVDELWPDFLTRVVPKQSSVNLYLVLGQRKRNFVDNPTLEDNPMIEEVNAGDDSKSDVILLGLSHFFWHPKAGHIRTLQGYVLGSHLLQIRAALLSGTHTLFTLVDDTETGEHGNRRGRRRFTRDQLGGVHLILAGDFNADAGTGTIDLLSQGHVTAAHPSWAFAELYALANAPPQNAQDAQDVQEAQETQEALDLRDVATVGENNCDIIKLAQADVLQSCAGDRLPSDRSPLPSDKACGPSLRLSLTYDSPSATVENSAVAEKEATAGAVAAATSPSSFLVSAIPVDVYPFTNHIGVFIAVLDWIFTSRSMTCTSFLPPVSLENIAAPSETQQGADQPEGSQTRAVLPQGIPTRYFPSDHIPLVVRCQLHDERF